MAPTFYDAKRQSHAGQRAASLSASITLVCDVERYAASFECAFAIRAVLPSLPLVHVMGVPCVYIPLEQMREACQKLSSRYSIALVDHVRDKYQESRFHCVWLISCHGTEKPFIPEPSTNLDDY